MPEAARVVILAAGRGTRMRKEDGAARLDAAQHAAADRGLKALIPFGGRPYLSYVLAEAAAAGLREACLVVGPETESVREHYANVRWERLSIGFAYQPAPLGSADALLAAEPFTRGEPFVVINADNVYPASVLSRVRELEGSGLAGFEAHALVACGIPEERLASYALVTGNAEGCLEKIVEKPGAAGVARAGRDAWISMTCWRFGPSIFDACRAVERSIRGEYELPDAVAYAASRGDCFRIVPVTEGVLDLSQRSDVANVSMRLRAREATFRDDRDR